MTEVSSTQALMDDVYRRQRHIYDASRKYFLLGRDHLIEALMPAPQGAHVLEIGCGTARNLIAAARAYPGATFYGLDISREMLATAAAHVRRAGLADRVRLGAGDATRFDAQTLFGRPTFDRVFFSYSLSMIPQWREAMASATGVVMPGGRVHLVDFGQQERLPDWFRRLLFAWVGGFHVEPRADLAKAAALLARERGGVMRFRPLYRGYAWYAEIAF